MYDNKNIKQAIVMLKQQFGEFSNRLTARSVKFGGTCTGEHGIGKRKGAYLREEMGDAVEIMKNIKTPLDPKNILNPGKIFKMDVSYFSSIKFFQCFISLQIKSANRTLPLHP